MSNYPLTSYHFQVDWGGTKMGFEEVKNLGFGIQIIEYRDGLSPEYSDIKMPGKAYYNNIILKRGVFKGDNEFYNWFNTRKLNTIERRDLTICLLDEEHNPVVYWKVSNAFPIRVSWSPLNAKDAEPLIEEIEIACESIVVSNG